MGTPWAEKKTWASAVGAGLDLLTDQFGHGADVTGVVVVAADAADGKLGEGGIALTQALEFAEAGAAGADGEVGIEGKDDHFINAVGLDVGDGGFGEGVPVAHGHVAGGLDAALAEGALKFACLLLGDAAEWRATADGAISGL